MIQTKPTMHNLSMFTGTFERQGPSLFSIGLLRCEDMRLNPVLATVPPMDAACLVSSLIRQKASGEIERPGSLNTG